MSAARTPPRPPNASSGRALIASCVVALGLAAMPLHAAQAAPAPAPALEQIMADPDWIGPPVEAAWWQLDADAIVYRVKRAGTERRDLHRVTLASGDDRSLDYGEQARLDGPAPVLDAAGERALSIREGSLFLRHLESGELVQITAGAPAVTRARFAAAGRAVHFLRDGRWYRYAAPAQATTLTDLRMEDSPLEPKADSLAPDQVRLFETLSNELAEARAAHDEAITAARMDPARDAPPWYLGKGSKIVDSELSADGRWLLAVIEAGAEDKTTTAGGKRERMPSFVTLSGYVEIEDVRTLVGRDERAAQSLWLLDLQTRKQHEVDLASLSAVANDPLAALKAAQDIDAHDADKPRPLRVLGMRWHPQRPIVALMLRAVDNKDRWLTTLEVPRTDAASPVLVERHRLADEAWINWAFNEFDWLPGEESLWFLSEETGYSHLYVVGLADGAPRQITQGDFEVFDVDAARDGTTALVISNRAHPTEQDLYRVDLATGVMTRLTDVRGVESYARHPLTDAVAIRHSEPYTPTQLAVLGTDDGLRPLTDTRTDAFRGIAWQQPTFVEVPSRHGLARGIWTKFYPARGPQAGRPGRPAVVFVHGAGYTQNTHHRFPYYFREQMFHNLLTARGYHVIDMDYRASRGYGRDWRTAIYRQMGTPELEDLRDGVAWLVEEHGVDPERVGIYGGSYGGFMTFMALFNAPETFAAGAALRPVTDWAHYNHGYTSNILNTPQVDPEAYRRSSPIEFVAGLEGDLLIAHGMLDDNVFYKDSVRLAQRLIELGKTDWEFASYPLEAHGYVHASSWLDQYRRILKLFETSIGNERSEPGR